MKIKTLIPVTYNSGIASQETSLVIGELLSCVQNYNVNGYSFSFRYTNEQNEVINTSSSNFTLTKEQVNMLYDVVKSSVPTDMEYFETTEYIYYLGFKIEMAKTFGITPNNIEIIVDSSEQIA